MSWPSRRRDGVVASPKDRTVRLSAEALGKRIVGRIVTGLKQDSSGGVSLEFDDGSCLVIRQGGSTVQAILHERASDAEDGGPRPTRRQREYLEFIRRYMQRVGMSPSEGDIQTHFMVSAPSVNQMVRTLERRGFISRDHDWFGGALPRSIRVLWEG